MISTILGLFSNPFFDLLGNPTFWLGVGLVIILGFLIFICIKYPKGGLPVLAGVFAVGLACLDAYCVIQLNLYYNAEGGIHGFLTGIFDTNTVEVVDDLTFEIKDIELTESTEGVYSASITTDQVLSLDTKESLGIFVNGMPCDTTSEVHSDFAYAEYSYTFYDNDKSQICTDTLIINIAFYENSTYLNLSTKGGTLPVEECVKYWHHYFNKNGFIVKVAPFNKASSDLGYTNGDISNYATINYYVNDELYSSDCVFKGETIDLITLEDNKFLGWQTAEGTLIYESIILEDNVNLYAKLADETTTSYIVDFINRGKKTSCVFYEGQDFEALDIAEVPGLTFRGWSENKTTNVINVKTFELTEDTTLYAIYRKDIEVYENVGFTIEELKNGITIDLDNYVDLSLETISYVYEFELIKYDTNDSMTLVHSNIDYLTTTFENESLGEGSLVLTLDPETNIIVLTQSSDFVPAEDTDSYYLTMVEFHLYML